MNKSQTIKLIKIEYTLDDLMQQVETKSERKVFAEVNSISQKEFFNAGTSGINPEYMFKMFVYDYKGETEIEFQGTIYSVYRTYEKGDYIELYVEGRVSNGAN